jgi:hypothetical protein
MLRGGLIAVLLLLAGCGGPSGKQEVREAWLDAVRNRDWERACDLSVPIPPDAGFTCEELLAEGMRGPAPAPDPAKLEVVRVGDAWKVHFEIQVIR